MGKPTGFLEFGRRDRDYAPVEERVKHWREFTEPLPDEELKRQGGRCMDCGTPYCHPACPVNNVIPDWNDLVFEGDFRTALAVLHSTNNFPDVTGRICPAPCEAACTLNLIEEPVTIKTIEHAIVERGWDERLDRAPDRPSTAPASASRWSAPAPPGSPAPSNWRAPGTRFRSSKNRRASAACCATASPISRWRSTSSTAASRRCGPRASTSTSIPMSAATCPLEQLMKRYDAVVLAIGAEQPRDLTVPGRDLKGIHFAMEFLPQQNRRVAGDKVEGADILAERQGRAGDRRRRYRLGLHRHLDPPRRALASPRSKSCRSRPSRRTSS